MKSIKRTIVLTMATVMAIAINVKAAESTRSNPFLAAFSAVATVDLPGKASELVAQADQKNIRQTTVDVVTAAVESNPAVATLVVSSVAEASPKTAGIAAATAVALVPNQEISIARAATAAAPGKAGSIVEAMCRVLPADYQKIANAVFEIAPGSGKEILAGVSAAIPQLKDLISQALAAYSGDMPSVSAVLNQVAEVKSASLTVLPSETISLPRGPSVGPPTIPISGTPPSPINPGTGGAVPPPGGYASP